MLVLGLNSDDSVRRLNKGPGRPFNSFSSRAFVLAHLASVDFVTGFDEDTPLELIRAVRPHVLVKGGDWAPESVVGREVVEADGGEVRCLPLLEGFSTTGLGPAHSRSGQKGAHVSNLAETALLETERRGDMLVVTGLRGMVHARTGCRSPEHESFRRNGACGAVFRIGERFFRAARA